MVMHYKGRRHGPIDATQLRGACSAGATSDGPVAATSHSTGAARYAASEQQRFVQAAKLQLSRLSNEKPRMVGHPGFCFFSRRKWALNLAGALLQHHEGIEGVF
jgi:hypothetical protein